jgi:hypothetical protein
MKAKTDGNEAVAIIDRPPASVKWLEKRLEMQA